MYMYDPKLGGMDVEVELGSPNSTPYISHGYYMDTFEELDEDALDYLNEKYEHEIATLAKDLREESTKGQERLLH